MTIHSVALTISEHYLRNPSRKSLYSSVYILIKHLTDRNY